MDLEKECNLQPVEMYWEEEEQKAEKDYLRNRKAACWDVAFFY